MTDAKMRGKELDGSLEILDLDMEQDYALDLEDNGDFDMDNEEDLDDENTGRTSSIFRITDPLAEEKKHAINPGQIVYDSNEDENENYLASRQLALFEGESDEEVEVGSDEEKDIVKAIREEITKLVAAEMKDELEIYNRPPALSARGEDSQTARDNNLTGIDPKLKEEIRKMRKLDRILERKMKEEKKVKRERIILEKQLRAELRSLLNEKKQISGDEKKNTEKFLALELPPSHNAGIHIDDDEIPDGTSSCCSPVFPTQPPEIVVGKRQSNAQRKPSPTESNSTVKASNSGCGTIDDHKNTNGNNSGMPSTTSSFTDTGLVSKPTAAPSDRMSTKSKQSRTDKSQKKNFIKRNIQLACEAQNSVAMTDEEKKRLNLLLADLYENDSEQDNAEEHSTSQKYDKNLEMEGCWLDEEEKQRLEAIDGRLKMLLPAEDFESINSVTPSYILPEQSASETELESRLEMLMDNDFLGEKVLRDNKEQRDLKTRLQEIDEQLCRLTSTPLALEADVQTPKLSEDQLNSLLEECARSLYSAASNNIETDSSVASTRAIMYENPVHLDPDTLRQLLEEAQQPRSIQSTDRSTNNSRFVPRPSSSQRISQNSHSPDDNFNSEQRNLQSPLETVNYLERNSPSSVERSFTSSPDHDAHPLNKYSLPPGPLFRNRSIRSSTKAISPSVSPPKPFLPEIDANACLVSRSTSSQSRLGSDDLPSVHQPPSSNKV